jgi:hypothetical protein
MSYIANAKRYLDAYWDTDDPAEQLQTLKSAIAEINVLISKIKEESEAPQS